MKKAFTLAEVLIVLGVVGIIAVMTLPTLFHRIRIAQLHTQFKKTYADLNLAAKLFQANENMTVPVYARMCPEDVRSDFILKRYMSYFKGVSTAPEANYGAFDVAHNIRNPKSGHNICDASSVMMDINGRLFVMDDAPYNRVYGYQDINYGPKICVDINGLKGPNESGYDRFVFVFTEDNTVVPYTGTSYWSITKNLTDEEQIKTYCDGNEGEHACAYFALKDKNPTGQGTYWKNFLK